MSSKKKFKLSKEEIVELLPHRVGCIATDKITIEGELVNYMYREEGIAEFDSGWRFFSGTEDQDYVDNADNSTFYALNTIANYDQAIIPYLNLPIGVELERLAGTNQFQVIPG